jgi:DNA primase
MNTPETTLYHKSQLLFGLYENLQTIRKERKVVVVEGEFDVISSVEAHMNTVVAIKGSALTADHVKILSRSVDQIILSLDADEAGIAATRKAIDVVATHQASREVPLTLSVLRIPNGKDPDEFSKSDPKGWRELVKKPSTAYEFLLAAACEKYDPTAAEGKLQIMTELAPVLSKITHAVQYEYYTKFLAERLGATLQSLKNDIKNYQLRNSMKTTKTTASSDSEKQPGQQKKATQSKQQSLESYLFFIACNARPQERAQWLSELQPELLVTPGSKQFLEVFSDPTKEFGEAGKQLPEDLQEVVFELATNPQYYASVETLDLAQEWKNTLKDLKAVQNKQVGQQIEKELEELDRIARKTAAQEARQAELLQQLVLLKRK